VVRGRLSRIIRLAYAAYGQQWQALPDEKGEGWRLLLFGGARLIEECGKEVTLTGTDRG
jgi:hypothetical protein